VIDLSATGYIQVHAYSSYAALPLQDVAITVTAQDGTAIAMRITNRSGKISPIAITVPDFSESQTPDSETVPFTSVNLHARTPGYEQLQIQNLQVFANTTTLQNLEMIPLSELPSTWDQTDTFDTPPQNL